MEWSVQLQAPAAILQGGPQSRSGRLGHVHYHIQSFVRIYHPRRSGFSFKRTPLTARYESYHLTAVRHIGQYTKDEAYKGNSKRNVAASKLNEHCEGQYV
jgi:hypothetical protein